MTRAFSRNSITCNPTRCGRPILARSRKRSTVTSGRSFIAARSLVETRKVRLAPLEKRRECFLCLGTGKQATERLALFDDRLFDRNLPAGAQQALGLADRRGR